MVQLQHSRRQGRKGATLRGQLRHARPAEAQALTQAEDLAVLIRWLREDILAVAGSDPATRQEWYDWSVAELRAREGRCAHRLRPVRTLLENQRAALPQRSLTAHLPKFVLLQHRLQPLHVLLAQRHGRLARVVDL